MQPSTLLTSAAAAGVVAAADWSPAKAAEYWEQRAQRFARKGRGLAAVCSYGMPAFYNAYIEHCQRRALLPWLKRLASLPGRRALDVGCGVGRWSLELAAMGYTVTGIDVSPSMIAQAECLARRRTLDCSFQVSDLNFLKLDGKFDLILCVTVLQHVLDPQQSGQAIARLSERLAVGGRLILLEAAPVDATSGCNTAVFHARTARWYRHALEAAKLSVIAERGVDPMPFKTWLLPYYRRLPALLSRAALAGVTLASWPLDVWLAQPLINHSWHRMIVATHAATAVGH